MSLENIQLPNFLLVDMYKDHLVELDNVQFSTTEMHADTVTQNANQEPVSEKTDLRYLGENNRHIAVLVDEPDAVFATQEDLTFLTNVFNACRITLGDIALLNINQHPLHYRQLHESLESQIVFLFNVEPAAVHLPFSVPHFQPQAFAGCTYVTAPSLSQLNQENHDARVMKSKLWVTLQKIFTA